MAIKISPVNGGSNVGRPMYACTPVGMCMQCVTSHGACYVDVVLPDEQWASLVWWLERLTSDLKVMGSSPATGLFSTLLATSST